MAFILENSQPAMQLENQLFAVPATFTDRWKTEHERINPTTILTDDGTAGDVNFFIPPGGLLGLSDICSELEVAINFKTIGTSSDWKCITDAEGVAPVNNFLHSLFQAVHVSVANRMLSDASTFYPYRAYLDSLLQYTADAQHSQLTSSCFYLDTMGNFNDDMDNEGEKIRRNFFLHQQYVQLSGKLFSDIFEQSKPLITGVPINMRLVMNNYCRKLLNTTLNE